MQQLEKKIKAVFDRGFVFYLLLSYRCLHVSGAQKIPVWSN